MAAAELVKFRPELPALMRKQVAKVWNAEYGERFLEGLRKAGLEIPEAGATAGQKSSTQPTSSTLRSGAVPDSGATRAEEGFWVAVLPFKYAGSSTDAIRHRSVSFRTKSDGMPGRNLKATQCGCVIDHAEAPNRCQQPRGRVHNPPVGRGELKNHRLQSRLSLPSGGQSLVCPLSARNRRHLANASHLPTSELLARFRRLTSTRRPFIERNQARTYELRSDRPGQTVRLAANVDVPRHL
jgi:hypothetical protein